MSLERGENGGEWDASEVVECLFIHSCRQADKRQRVNVDRDDLDCEAPEPANRQCMIVRRD